MLLVFIIWPLNPVDWLHIEGLLLWCQLVFPNTWYYRLTQWLSFWSSLYSFFLWSLYFAFGAFVEKWWMILCDTMAVKARPLMDTSEWLSSNQQWNYGALTCNAGLKLSSLALNSSLLIVSTSFLKKNLILWTIDISHDLPWILNIWTVIPQLLHIVLVKVLHTPQIFSHSEYTFETCKTVSLFKQFILRSTLRLEGDVFHALQWFVTICVYLSQNAFNWSKSGPILKWLTLSVTAAELFQKLAYNQTRI